MSHQVAEKCDLHKSHKFLYLWWGIFFHEEQQLFSYQSYQRAGEGLPVFIDSPADSAAASCELRASSAFIKANS